MIQKKHIGRAHILLLSAAMSLCVSRAYAETNLVEISADCSSLEYHLRLEAMKNTDSRCSIIWNYTDSANYRAVRYDIPSLTSSDNLAGFESSYELIECKDGVERILSEGTFRDNYSSRPALSAMLRVLSSSACVEIGTKEAVVSIPVSYSRSTSLAGYECNHGLREIRNDITAERIPLPQKSKFGSLDSLRNYIAASKDPYEAFWIYLDRDTDITKASPGGRYTLATVSDGKGSYDIVYVDGIESDNTPWQPFTVKGRLSPTIFADHFNLQWLDIYGRKTDEEANASIEVQGTVLKLTFPLLKSSMRFSRATK